MTQLVPYSQVNPGNPLPFYSSTSAPASPPIRGPRQMLGLAYEHALGTDRTGSSVTALSLGLGSRTLTFSTPIANSAEWAIGGDVAFQNSPSIWMRGTLTAISANDVTINVTSFNGSGSYSSWTANFIDPKSSWTDGFKIGNLLITGVDYMTDQARLASVSDFGVAVSGVSRTYGGGGVDSIGSSGFAINDRVGSQKAWGNYADGVKALAGAGDTHGLEVNATNVPGVSPRGGATPYNPYVAGMIIGLAVAVGSDGKVFGPTYAADALVELRANPSCAHAGIVFRSNAVLREGHPDDTTDTGNVGYARAISLANEQGVSMYSRDPVGAPGSGTQAEVVRLYSDVVDPAHRVEQVFGDTTIAWNEMVSTGAALFQIDYRSDAGCNIYVSSGAIGEAATIGVRGINPNIVMTLAPKGVGWVSFGSLNNVRDYTNDAAAAAAGLNIGAIYRTGSALKVRVA